MPLLGLSISLVGFLFAKDIFMLLGAKQGYLQDALDYIYTILMGVVFFMGNFALNAILIATGDTKSYRNTLVFGFFCQYCVKSFVYLWLFVYSCNGNKRNCTCYSVNSMYKYALFA